MRVKVYLGRGVAPVLDRLAKRILQSAILVTVCSVAVVVVIGTVQSIAAICTATSIISTLRDIHRDLVGFGAIVAGYCSLYAGGAPFSDLAGEGAFAKRHFRSMARRGFRLADPAACGTAIGCVCVCRNRPPAAAHRNTPRLVWFGGTALPLLIAWALFGPLISGWQFPWLVW